MRLLATLLLLFAVPLAHAQPDPPKREFRGVWIATVGGLDWPDSGATPERQQQQLVGYLDNLRASGVNAIFFQIRPEGDALYQSELEPWAHVLTGTQGQDPGWDPLAFAIEEAHARGMELHAWLNPFRARASANPDALAPTHVLSKHPEWVITYGAVNRSYMDPGRADVRAYNASIVADIVRRYDVDGVHFDDYFYPYPNGGANFPGITNEDDASYAADPRGLSRSDWRRDNINRFVQQVADTIAAIDPHVKYGISPFGIWQSGVPRGIVGLNAFTTIYADATAWTQARSLDYLAPQLYWPFGGGQDYGKLAPWWQSQMAGGRHLYPGLPAYKNLDPAELPRMIRFNQDTGIQGSIIFRNFDLITSGRTVVDGQVIRDYNPLRDSLRQALWRNPALPPTMPWKDDVVPLAPASLDQVRTDEHVRIAWEAPAAASDGDVAAWYAVYRFETDPDLPAALEQSRHLLAVLPADSLAYTDRTAQSSVAYRYAVTALDRLWNESAATQPLVATSSAEPDAPGRALRLHAPQPNPSSGETMLRFTLGQAATVTARIYSAVGQEVATLVRSAPYASGTHVLQWSPDGLASGAYFVVVETPGARETVALTRLR